MRVALSADMEAVSQIRGVREVLACCEEYWTTGRARFTADVAAAAAGLLDGGAGEVVVLDNHASGHTQNLLAADLPAGARVENWSAFELADRGVGAMLQVGYHPRAGVDGFVPHTYVPGLRVVVDGEPVGESHGRVWAAGVPLLGIVGNSALQSTLGSLRGAAFLAVQDSHGTCSAAPIHGEPRESAAAIRAFAREAMRERVPAPGVTPPREALLEITLGDADDEVVRGLEATGWTRTGTTRFAAALRTWAEARPLLDVAMLAGIAPFAGSLAAVDMSSREAVERAHPAARAALAAQFCSWAADAADGPDAVAA